MGKPQRVSFETRTIDELVIEDEASFRHVALYADLKNALRTAKYQFRVLPRGRAANWDRALFLNLTYWRPDQGGDVLVERRLPADVVSHAAWHHLAATALASPSATRPTAEALFLGEAIASAFDLYLVGRLLGHAPKSSFLATQVPAMAEAAHAAGLGEREFEAMLSEIARAPEKAFEDLRELLMEATTALYASEGPREALVALAKLDKHRFGPLLHRYELSNWVLYARAHASRARADRRARKVDDELRRAKSALDWLSSAWVLPALS